MDTILENDFLKTFLNKCLENNINHHFLFYGLPGCAKTTLTRLYLKQKYKKSENYLEINSSDNRGINYYKDVLKKFIDNKTIKDKIIFLDEADNLTQDSQKYIINILEYINGNNMDTKFIIVCNYFNNINEDILNKCFIFRFKNITLKNMKKEFDKLLIENNMKIKNKNKIIKSFQKDFRNLKFYFNISNDIDNIIDYEIIYKELLSVLVNNDKITKKYKKIDKIIYNINIKTLIDDFLKYCLKNTEIDKKKLIKIFHDIKKNIGLDYNKKLKIYEIIFSFYNI